MFVWWSDLWKAEIPFDLPATGLPSGLPPHFSSRSDSNSRLWKCLMKFPLFGIETVAVWCDKSIIVPIRPLFPLYLFRILTLDPMRNDDEDEISCELGAGSAFIVRWSIRCVCCSLLVFSAAANWRLIIIWSNLDCRSLIWSSRAVSDKSGTPELFFIPLITNQGGWGELLLPNGRSIEVVVPNRMRSSPTS